MVKKEKDDFLAAQGFAAANCLIRVSGLGPNFPKFTIADMVNSQYQLVTEGRKIKHLVGVAGASMGGMQTLQWITQ